MLDLLFSMSIAEKSKRIRLQIKQEKFKLGLKTAEGRLRTKQVIELNCRDSRLAALKNRSDKICQE